MRSSKVKIITKGDERATERQPSSSKFGDKMNCDRRKLEFHKGR